MPVENEKAIAPITSAATDEEQSPSQITKNSVPENEVESNENIFLEEPSGGTRRFL